MMRALPANPAVRPWHYTAGLLAAASTDLVTTAA